MTAGEQKIIVFYANPQPPLAAPNPVSLAGATVLLKVQPPSGALASVSMTVVSAGDSITHYAYYRTLAADFPIGGRYVLQVIASWVDGTILKIPETVWLVGGALA